MKDMQVPKGNGRIAGVISLTLAAGLLLFLTGCQGPLAPDGAAGTGTVSVTIDAQSVGRAIMPGGMTMASFDAFSVVFSHATFSDIRRDLTPEQANAGVDETITAGTWTLTVTAYGGTDPAARVPQARAVVQFTLEADGEQNLAPVLRPIRTGAPTGSTGTFQWNLTFPANTTARRYVHAITAGAIGLPIDAHGGNNAASGTWTGTMPLPVADYYVVFVLTHPVYGTLVFGRDLHVYMNLTSAFTFTFLAEDFIPAPTLGDFVFLFGMGDRDWQDTPIDTTGAVVVDGDQPLRPSGSPDLGWNMVNGRATLSVTGRTSNYWGIDLLVAHLGFTADGVYQVTVTGTMAAGSSPALGNNPWDAAQPWANAATVERQAGMFTLTSARFALATLNDATAIRVQGTVNEDFVVTGITIARVDTVCDMPGCGRYPCVLRPCGNHWTECACTPPVFSLADWLVGPPLVTDVTWASRPLRGNDWRDGASNATLRDGGVDLDVAGAHHGVDILLYGHAALNGLELDLVNYIYEIIVVGQILGTPTGPIVVGAGDGGDSDSVGTSGELTAENAPFTITGYVSHVNIPPHATSRAIRIRNETGQANFRITQIEIDRYGPAPLQTVADVAAAALSLFAPNNYTTAADVMAVVDGVITNPAITTSWQVPFSLTQATSAADGSVTGTIRLTLGSYTADIPVSFTIPQIFAGYLFRLQDMAAATDVSAHFAGINNRGTVSVGGSAGAWTVTWAHTPGNTDGNIHNPEGQGWSPMLVLRPDQIFAEGRTAAVGDVLRVTGTLSFDGVGTPPFAMDHGPMGLAPVGASIFTGDARITDNNTLRGTAWEVEHVLTATDITAGIRIAWHFWGGPLGGNGVRDNNFTVTITGAELERE